MEKRHTHQRRVLVIASVVGLSLAAAVALCQVEPSGRKAGLIQFDAMSELNMDWKGYTNAVVFARYWVCRDYYAVSALWCEPHGEGVTNMKTLVVLSNRTSIRMDDALLPDHVPANTTYPKPLGERGPFQWGGGMYEITEMRFAEAQALSRRVYVSDLGPLKDAGTAAKAVDLKVGEGPGMVKRELAQLKVRAAGNRVEALELLDERQQLLGRMRYEYDSADGALRISRLIADLPVRPEKLGVKGDAVVTPAGGGVAGRYTFKIDTIDYAYHQGGRTCTVDYRDVALGGQALRLPARVEVRISDSKRLLRSARFIDFKRVELDKASVWEAARAFARPDSEDAAWLRLVQKYINHTPKLGPLRVDPNDHAFVKRLLAKYPTPNVTASPRERPRQIDIEPDDARVMRQLYAYYVKTRPKRQRQEVDMETRVMSFSVGKPDETHKLRHDLRRTLDYHRAPELPEDRPPEPDANDRQLVRQLQEHYGTLATQTDRGLGGQLQALHALTRLDRMLKDYDAFEAHTLRYLRLLDEAELPAMYMVGGCGHIETLAEAGQYEKANRLLRRWADKSAGENDGDAIFRFARSNLGGGGDPWLNVQLLDRFLKRPGLSPLERYEGLALRAIALDKIDKLLASIETTDSEKIRAQGRWVLSSTTRAELAARVEPALRQALSAWQTLGPLKESTAKPYSTANLTASQMNMQELTEATGLQETSAELDRIIRERTGNRPNGWPRTGP